MAVAAAAAGPSIINIDLYHLEVDEVLRIVRESVGQLSLMAFLETTATEFFQDDIESRFEEEGDPKSGYWAPLADATIDIRRADGWGDGPINERTGELKDFMLGEYEVFGGPMWAEMNVPGTPSDPITARKLKTAQQGSNDNPLGYGPTPARPVLAVSEMDLWTLTGLLSMHIIGQIEAHTL